MLWSSNEWDIGPVWSFLYFYKYSRPWFCKIWFCKKPGILVNQKFANPVLRIIAVSSLGADVSSARPFVVSHKTVTFVLFSEVKVFVCGLDQHVMQNNTLKSLNILLMNKHLTLSKLQVKYKGYSKMKSCLQAWIWRVKAHFW
mgnify:CR=1 FL=1